MYPTGLLRILNFKLSDRATPDKIALAEGGTVLFETRSFVSLSFTVRACKLVDLFKSFSLKPIFILNYLINILTVVNFACNFTYIFSSVVYKLISLIARLGGLWSEKIRAPCDAKSHDTKSQVIN